MINLQSKLLIKAEQPPKITSVYYYCLKSNPYFDWKGTPFFFEASNTKMISSWDPIQDTFNVTAIHQNSLEIARVQFITMVREVN